MNKRTGTNVSSRMVIHIINFIGGSYSYTKKELALELNIPYRALLRLYNGKQSENDVVAIMSGIALYCLRERIPPDTLFHGFAPR